jgi:alpha-beta hydrolase superfamily lysophospholipase
LIIRAAVLAGGAVCLAGCGRMLDSFEKKTLNPGVRSAASPADLGLTFQRVAIPSGSRALDGFLVRAETACPAPSAAILLFHGRNETVADWIKVQKYLHDHCVSSLAFDYSGHGRSAPTGTVQHLDEDAVAAGRYFMQAFSATQRRCWVSHSMGAGPLLYAATQAGASPDCVVVASPFSSLRAEAVRGGLPKAMSFLMPDVWNNARAARSERAPLMWIHSRTDTTIPLASGQAVYDAETAPKRSVVVSGFAHNAIYDQTPDAIWSPILDFVRKGPPGLAR